MKTMKPIIACLAVISTVSWAQQPGGGKPSRPDGPPRVDVAKVLDLDEARAAKVNAILKASGEKRRALHESAGGPPKDDAAREAMHRKMKALRDDTDRQLLAVLSPAELAKLREAMPRPPRPGEGGGPR